MKMTIDKCADDSRFNCPECGGACRVTDTRITNARGEKQRRRRYRCIKCGYRFTTVEHKIKEGD